MTLVRVVFRYVRRNDHESALRQQPTQGGQKSPVTEAGARSGAVEAVMQGDDDAR